MARKKIYTINRFDGGITDKLRSGDYTKCAHVSHFDIYQDPNRLIPLPGYVDDMHDGSTSTGMKQYGLQGFWAANGYLYAVGRKSDNTGTKFFSKDSATSASWSAMSNGEGTDDLASNTFLVSTDQGGNFFVVTNAGTSTYLARYQNSVGVTDKYNTMQTALTSLPHIVEFAFDTNYYYNTGFTDVGKISGTTITDPSKSTGGYVTDVCSGDEQIGIMQYRFYPYKAQLLLWDSASLLADQKVEFGDGRESALGNVSGVWVAAVANNLVSSAINDEYANGEYSLDIKYLGEGGAKTLTRFFAATNTNGALLPIRSRYRDCMLFYARIPQDATPTTYKEGIWAVGRSREDSPMAVSLLLDTGSLGSIEGFYSHGKHSHFAHGGDGSISRLDDLSSGTYDVDGEYHSLFFGSDTPNLKQLNGVGILTEDLPNGASVTLYYRFDENDSWSSFGTSSTEGSEKHQFTKASGISIGGFREIQFKIVVSGKVIIKNIIVSISELDDIGFSI